MRKSGFEQLTIPGGESSILHRLSTERSEQAGERATADESRVLSAASKTAFVCLQTVRQFENHFQNFSTGILNKEFKKMSNDYSSPL